MATPDPVYDSIKLCFQQTCFNTFGKIPYQWQTDVGTFVLGCHLINSPLKLLLVRPTGGGKTLVFTSIAACIKGITLCITPLLSLGADQVQKIMSKTSETNKTIVGFHLDELNDAQLLDLKTYLSTLLPTTLKTIVLFSSPQRIVSDNGPAADLMSEIIVNNKIRFIVFDEIHLAVHYGKTFRKEFGQLKGKLFNRMPSQIPMLFMTATCTASIASSFESLMGIKFDAKDWPTSIGMMHRSVRIEAKYTTCPAALVKKAIREPLRPVPANPDLPNKVIVYSNSRRKIVQFSEQLGEEFDHHDDLQDYDIITLVGTLKRQQKAMFITKFINMADSDDFKPRVLCATSGVGNAGIDSPDIRAVFRLDFPPSIIDVCQEKGRAGRRPNALQSDYIYYIAFSLESFIHLFKRIHDPENNVIDKSYREHQVNDLLQVAKLLSSMDCFSLRLEMMLGNPGTSLRSNVICGACPNCVSPNVLFPSISKTGCRMILMDLFVAGRNTIVTKRTEQTLEKAMVLYPNINQLLFHSAAVKVVPLKIKKTIFVLIAAGIITLKYLDNEVHLRLAISNDSTHVALNEEHVWNTIRQK